MTGLLNADELRALAARASTIDERMAGGYVPLDSVESTRAAARRLYAWCGSATAGDEQLFDKRLAFDGLDARAVQPLLGDVLLLPETPLPGWVVTFRWALETMTSSAGLQQGCDKGTGFLKSEQPLPFEELFVPLVTAAQRRSNLVRSRGAKLLTESAHAGLQRILLSRLTQLCGSSLFEGFSLYRIAATPHAMFYGLPMVGDAGSRTLYRRYIAALRQGEIEACFAARPVLARLVATVTELWISSTAKFLERLATDLSAILDTFHGGRPPGMVSKIRGQLSDPHNGGQSVLVLTFEDGLKIGYKPRDLSLDAAWRNLVRWLDVRSAPPSAGATKVLPRESYGWVEWIQSAPCADQAAAERFFERAGAMLCLLQFLRGTDFHFENVLAYGEQPVPVDLETLAHPMLPDPWREGRAETVESIAARRLRESALATSYLPKWVAMPGGPSAIGGLNPAELRQAKRWGFNAPNTDGMSFEPTPAPKASTSHLPTLRGQPLSAVAFRTQIECGYAAMYRFLMKERNALFRSEGPLDSFRGQVVRIVLRPTVLYSGLLRKSLGKRNLTDGVDWSLHFDFLTRLSDFFEEKDEIGGVKKAERRALEKLDIPYMTGRTDSTALWLPDGTIIEEFFEESCFEQLTRQAKRMSEVRLKEQLSLIGQALRFAGDGPPPRTSTKSRSFPENGKVPPDLTTKLAVETARSLAAKLEALAVRGRNGITWIGAVPLPGENRAQLDVVGHNLYSGAGGIALFLSALHHLTGEDTYRISALEALAPLRSELERPHRRTRLARVMGIGGGSGIGSLVYALTRSASLLNDSALLDDALLTSKLITDSLIMADRSHDVIAGAAGAVLGLLALHRVQPNPLVLDRAIACGLHLVANQRDCSPEGRAWRTFGQRELTGFSHGASGIALALLRLYRATGTQRFLLAAREGIRYENALFSAEAKNWRDLRETTPRHLKAPYACQWCHGAPGIGLARLGALEVLDESSMCSDIDVAVRTTADAPDLPADHLCCGNFGRLELLFVAGRRLRRNDLTLEAIHRAVGLVARAEDVGGFRWSSGLDDFNPGFFTGLSGVAYEILRMTHPEDLPSVLLWD